MKSSFNELHSISHTGIIDDNYKANIAKVSNSSIQKLENTTEGEHEDITVKNGDFFASLHMLMKNKHNYLHNSSRQPEDHHKVRLGISKVDMGVLTSNIHIALAKNYRQKYLGNHFPLRKLIRCAFIFICR